MAKVFTFLKNKWALIAAALLLLVFILQGLFSMKGDSAIVDEIAHIPAGYSYITTLDYRLNPEHPPLAKDLAGLFLLSQSPKFPYEYWASGGNNQWEVGWKFIYRFGNDADKIIFFSRLPILILAAILALILFFIVKNFYGKLAALFALTLFVFEPNIITHARLVTTDMAITATTFFAVFAFYYFLKKPSWKSILLAGLILGLANLSKFSSVLLLPILAIIGLGKIFVDNITLTIVKFLPKLKIKKSLLKNFFKVTGQGFLVVIISFLLVWGVYAIQTANMSPAIQKQIIEESLPSAQKAIPILEKLTDHTITKPISYYLLGIQMVLNRSGGGNTTFLVGEVSNYGWWYYFIVAFLIKTPIPIILFILAALIFKIKKRSFEFLDFVLLIPIFVILGYSMKSTLNIGLRHILPIYPFLIFWAASLFKTENINWLKKLGHCKCVYIALGTILMLWLIIGTLFTYPSYLAYFNELVGGSKNGWKYLVDSNLDWGQDLKRLASWVDEYNNKAPQKNLPPIENIKIDYFGGGLPSYEFSKRNIKFQEWHSQYGPTHGWLAVSATFYRMSHYYFLTQGQPDYSWLDNQKPVIVVGNSILVYNIP